MSAPDFELAGAALGVDYLRRRLEEIVAKTPGADGVLVPGYWVGDKAGVLRVGDDGRRGRLEWRACRNRAKAGLAELDAGNLGLAFAFWREADTLYKAALERVGAKGIAALGRSARRRHPASAEVAERNARLAKAVAKQEALGLTGKAARSEAVAADAALRNAFKGLGDSALETAIRRNKTRQK